jgi:hypothetical protein
MEAWVSLSFLGSLKADANMKVARSALWNDGKLDLMQIQLKHFNSDPGAL